MAQFSIDKPIATREPTIVVDTGLRVGRHRFQLEVENASGRRSAADIAIVEVQQDLGRVRDIDTLRPLVAIEPVKPAVRPLVTPTPLKPTPTRKKRIDS